jgi:hypothetical protein
MISGSSLNTMLSILKSGKIIDAKAESLLPHSLFLFQILTTLKLILQTFITDKVEFGVLFYKRKEKFRYSKEMSVITSTLVTLRIWIHNGNIQRMMMKYTTLS